MYVFTRFVPVAALSLFALAACNDDKGSSDGVVQCSTADPSSDPCSIDTDCASGQRCLETGQCRSSSCSCESGAWTCTDDCSAQHECVTPRACTGPNPADKGCYSDINCPTGETCNMHVYTSAICDCDPKSGQWLCMDSPSLATCGAPPVCGVDPSKDGCYDDRNCAAGDTCKIVAGDACRPSSCTCDEATKAWGCSKDCQPYHACAR